MEETVIRAGRRSGWSDTEEKLLWETAEEAQSKGLPLKAVFERIASRTGRKPNSIRNYYYQQVRAREGDRPHPARFVPFTQEEVDRLMREVLTATGQGQSVRSCLSRISGGDHSLMLRYQNKYRSVIKSRPDYVQLIVDQLRAEGVRCDAPCVNHRAHADLEGSAMAMSAAARRTGDAELARACDAFRRLLEGSAPDLTELTEAAQRVIRPFKEFAALPPERRVEALDGFIETLTERIGRFEAALPVPDR